MEGGRARPDAVIVGETLCRWGGGGGRVSTGRPSGHPPWLCELHLLCRPGGPPPSDHSDFGLHPPPLLLPSPPLQVRRDNPRLTTRREGHAPVRVVMSRTLDLPAVSGERWRGGTDSASESETWSVVCIFLVCFFNVLFSGAFFMGLSNLGLTWVFLRDVSLTFSYFSFASGCRAVGCDRRAHHRDDTAGGKAALPGVCMCVCVCGGGGEGGSVT